MKLNCCILKRFAKEAGGTASIEFAALTPPFLVIVFGGLAFIYAAFVKNGLQEAANATARCVAISSSLCNSVTTGCDSTTAGVCYAETIAKTHGLSNLTASNVSINQAASFAGSSFTTVTITYPFTLAGYSITLAAQGYFPNSS